MNYTVKHNIASAEKVVAEGVATLAEATEIARESLISREFPGHVFDGPAWVEDEAGVEVLRLRGLWDAPGFQRVVEEVK